MGGGWKECVREGNIQYSGPCGLCPCPCQNQGRQAGPAKRELDCFEYGDLRGGPGRRREREGTLVSLIYQKGFVGIGVLLVVKAQSGILMMLVPLVLWIL